MRSATLSLLAATLATPVFAGVQEIWWNLSYVENANPDGLFARRAIGVNGTWPYVLHRTIHHLIIAKRTNRLLLDI